MFPARTTPPSCLLSSCPGPGTNSRRGGSAREVGGGPAGESATAATPAPIASPAQAERRIAGSVVDMSLAKDAFSKFATGGNSQFARPIVAGQWMGMVGVVWQQERLGRGVLGVADDELFAGDSQHRQESQEGDVLV